MTRARLSTKRDVEYEIVQLLDDASYVLRLDGDVRVFEESSTWERFEVRCDFCGRWNVDAAPVVVGPLGQLDVLRPDRRLPVV